MPTAEKVAYMPILVKLSASLRKMVPDYNPLTGIDMQMPAGHSVAGVLGHLGIAPKEVKVIMVNGVAASTDRELEEGDRVALFPAVGGG
jgi:sulfur carrier protein ThiS